MTGFSVKVLADSVAPGGERLTTVQATFPRFILAELNTHRLLSRNSASSRAIPTAKLLEQVRDNPVLPVYWGKNQSGMQAQEQLDYCGIHDAKGAITYGAAAMAGVVDQLDRIGLHKQNANRYIEPWMWHTAIISATEWENFFAQRDTWPDPSQPPGPAQPEFAVLARQIREAMEASTPKKLKAGEWHLPLVETEDRTSKMYISASELDVFSSVTIGGKTLSVNEILCSVSAARCARVSYLTHEGKRDILADMHLHDRLVSMKHWSPLEHVAQAMEVPSESALAEIDEMLGEWHINSWMHGLMIRGLAAERWSGNFRGWVQYRKLFQGEHAGHAPGDNP